MRKLIIIICFLVSVFCSAQSTFHRSLLAGGTSSTTNTFDTIDCIILAGQSNAEGRADTANVPAQYEDRILIEHPVNKIYYSDLAANQWQPMNPPVTNKQGGSSPGDDFGAFVSLADTVNRYTANPLWVLTVTEGNTSLAVDGTKNDWNVSSAELYLDLKNKVTNSRLSAINSRVILRYKAFVWMQGEADTADSTWAANYETNLTTLINTFRSETGLDIPWVIVRTKGADGSDPTGVVRAAQVSVAGTLTDVEWISSDSYTLKDSVHYDAASQIQCGFDIFQRLLSIGVF